jgi:hypothetical protein
MGQKKFVRIEHIAKAQRELSGMLRDDPLKGIGILMVLRQRKDLSNFQKWCCGQAQLSLERFVNTGNLIPR